MSSILANMGLVAWTSSTDPFNSTQLALNIQKIDQHDHSPGKGAPLSANSLADGSVDAFKIADGSVGRAKLDADVNAALDSIPTTAGQIPIGGMTDWAGSSDPAGGSFVIADGRELSRSAYPDLFSAIGTVHGDGDGSTTFNIPDSQGRTVVGAGQGSGLTNRVLGSQFGEENHTLTAAEMPVHSHGITVNASGSFNTGTESADHKHYIGVEIFTYNSGGGNNAVSVVNYGTSGEILLTSSGRTAAHSHIVPPHDHSASATNAGSGSHHNNVQPSIALNKIIRVL